MIFQYNAYLKEYWRDNRNHQTKEEWKMWHLVLKQDKTWYRFLRQKPIGNYILDFYCDKLKLWIEIDDMSHDYRAEDDEERTKYLNKIGIKIIRYTNGDINYRLEWVILDLEGKLEERRLELEKIPRPNGTPFKKGKNINDFYLQTKTMW